MYYIVDDKGNSLFELPYNYDFCVHCLWLMFNRNIDVSKYRLVSLCGEFLFLDSVIPSFSVCSLSERHFRREFSTGAEHYTGGFLTDR